MFNPTSIAQAINLARLYEATKPLKPTTRTFTLASKPYSIHKTYLSPSSFTFHQPQWKPLFNSTNRTYSAAEMAERRAKGLCMFCDEPFVSDHQLKHKHSQMLVMKLADDEEILETTLELVLTPTTNI